MKLTKIIVVTAMVVALAAGLAYAAGVLLKNLVGEL